MYIESYEYEVRAIVKFSREEVFYIKHLGLRHYDLTCKRTCWVGGFVYRMDMILRNENSDTVTATLTGEELGLLGKIGELEPHSGITSYVLELIRNLHAEWQHLNKTDR